MVNDLHTEIMFESDEALIKCLAMLQSTLLMYECFSQYFFCEWMRRQGLWPAAHTTSVYGYTKS